MPSWEDIAHYLKINSRSALDQCNQLSDMHELISVDDTDGAKLLCGPLAWLCASISYSKILYHTVFHLHLYDTVLGICTDEDWRET